MATIDEVRHLLRNLGDVEVAEKQDGYFSVSVWRNTYRLSEEEVDKYLMLKDKIVLGSETSIYFPRSYEHIVDILHVRPIAYRPFLREEDSINLVSPDERITVILSGISSVFYLTLVDRMDRRLISRVFRRVPFRNLNDNIPILHTMVSRILSIKVSVKQDGHVVNLQILKSLAEASLFNISYSRGIALGMSRSWERSSYRLNARRDNIQFPHRTYVPELVSYYQLALSSDSLLLSYLSLYNVLEFFFLSTAEKELHKRMTEKLAAPDFNITESKYLRELTAIIRRLDQKMDEQRALSSVLNSYFMPDEIIDWLNNYEIEFGKYYTETKIVLGLNHKIDVNPEKLASSIAQRIYHIRNALVHNKEGEMPRFNPFSEQEDILVHELPLITFLAEQIIIKTGKNISRNP